MNFITAYEINEDGRAAWGERTLTLNLEHEEHEDGGYSGSYFQRYHANSAQKSSPYESSQDPYPFVQTVAGFVTVLLFFVVCCIFADRPEDVSKKEVDRSIITKKVLQHDQSHQFISEDCSDEKTSNTSCCSYCLITPFSCCERRKQQSVAPDGESTTAEGILETYRSKTTKHIVCAHCNSVRPKNDNGNTRVDQTTTTGGDDNMALVEEGLSTNNEEIECSICMEIFHVGEEVSWSRIGQCRHFFHYDCILPWAMLGHVRCPVCRLLFWTPKYVDQRRGWCSRRVVGSGNNPAFEMQHSRFCVQHGLVAPLISAEV